MSPEDQVSLREYLGEKIDALTSSHDELRREFRDFKRHTYDRFDPLEADLDQRIGTGRAYTRVWRAIVGGSAVMGATAGLVFAFARTIFRALAGA